MYIKNLILIFFITVFAYNITFSQCKDDMGVFKCAEIFNKENIAYLNDFSLNIKKRKSVDDENGQTWEIYLLGNNKYRFALCCYEGLEDIEMRLFDKDNTESNPFGTTFKEGKDIAYFDFECKKSNLYYISIRFKNTSTLEKKLCAIGLLGFAGKVK